MQDGSCRLVLNLDNAYTAACAQEAAAEVIWFSRKQVPEKGFSFHDEVIWRGDEPFLVLREMRMQGAEELPDALDHLT